MSLNPWQSHYSASSCSPAPVLVWVLCWAPDQPALTSAEGAGNIPEYHLFVPHCLHVPEHLQLPWSRFAPPLADPGSPKQQDTESVGIESVPVGPKPGRM